MEQQQQRLQTIMEGYKAFLRGGNAADCGIAGPWLDEVESRNLELHDLGGELGRAVYVPYDIKPYGKFCVYGGDVLDRAAAEDGRPKTHMRVASLRSGMVIDGIDAQKLPSTHWGAMINSSKTPNAKFETVTSTLWPSEVASLVPPIVVCQALGKGIPAGSYISIDYAVEPHLTCSVLPLERWGEAVEFAKQVEPTNTAWSQLDRLAKGESVPAGHVTLKSGSIVVVDATLGKDRIGVVWAQVESSSIEILRIIVHQDWRHSVKPGAHTTDHLWCKLWRHAMDGREWAKFTLADVACVREYKPMWLRLFAMAQQEWEEQGAGKARRWEGAGCGVEAVPYLELLRVGEASTVANEAEASEVTAGTTMQLEPQDAHLDALCLHEPTPLAVILQEDVPFRTDKLQSIASWQAGRRGCGAYAVFVAEASHEESLPYFECSFPDLKGKVMGLLQGATVLKMTCIDRIVALVSFRPFWVEEELVMYIALLTVDDGKATDAAYGSFADGEPWRGIDGRPGRGIGQLMLHLVRREACTAAAGKPFRLELQSNEEMKSWYLRRGFTQAALTCGVAKIDDDSCAAMCWLPGSAKGSGSNQSQSRRGDRSSGGGVGSAMEAGSGKEADNGKTAGLVRIEC